LPIVSAKINNTQVQHTRASKNPQIESASLSIIDGFSFPSILEIELSKLNDSLFTNRFIIIGSIIKIITVTPIIPVLLLIRDKLEVTYFNASLTEAPTNGTKLLIAKRAVFIDNESLPCAMFVLNEKTNINIDIVNTVTEEKAVLIVFVIPLKSHEPPRVLIQLKDKLHVTNGSIIFTKNSSTKEINRSIEELDAKAKDVLPDIMLRLIITGMKEFITFESRETYVTVDFANCAVI
jgi:hypothetical protein